MTQTQPIEPSQSWVARMWELLNAPVEPTWMHTLFQGLVAAVISAGIALLVLLVTVRTQNKGIRRQIEAQQESLRAQLAVQECSVAEQLRVQRHENTKIREHAAGVQFIRAAKGYALAVANNRRLHGVGQEESLAVRREAMILALEELRLNSDALDDITIQIFHRYVKWLFQKGGRSPYSYDYGEGGPTVLTLEHFLVEQMSKYVRSDNKQRAAMTQFLLAAYREGKTPEAEWVDRFMAGYEPQKSKEA